MTEYEAGTLLLRIVYQPGFRDQLIADPVAALAQVGVSCDPGDVPTTGVSLPSNADILSNLDGPIKAMVAGCMTHVHVFLRLGG